MQETKTSLYWAGGLTAAVVAVVILLWLAGIFEAAPPVIE